MWKEQGGMAQAPARRFRTYQAPGSCSRATRTSWARVRVPVLRNKCCNTDLTTGSLEPTSAAIALFESPSTTSRRILASLAVNGEALVGLRRGGALGPHAAGVIAERPTAARMWFAS